MTPILHITARSIWNRRSTVGLTVVVVALSVALLLAVERLRNDARASFAATISGTDLVVGARSGPVQLLLYSVFHIGNATNNVSWDSYQTVTRHKAVSWSVPLSLGDSHRGFRVIGTDEGFFQHVRTGDKRPLSFQAGQPFHALFDAVIGAEVADHLGYTVGRPIVLAHGAGEVSLVEHADKPFTVSGILGRTGTPIDRSVLVSLPAIEAIHIEWQGGAPLPGLHIPIEDLPKFNLAPKTITAALVGLKSRAAVFQVQRFVNDYASEPLLAILPGATLQELWSVVAVAEQALLAVSALVVLVGLAGLVAVMIASLGERRRELAILRALGAGPWQIFALLACESLALTLAGIGLSLVLFYGAAAAVAPWTESRYGLVLSLASPSAREWGLLALVVAAALAASVVPGLRAYRLSLADGMTVRL